jgi:thiol-disulfide isomerase/thioredoxin
MSFASLLLALMTVTSNPASNATSGPVLLDFHAEWCGPCQKMRRTVEQLVDQGYPVKSIDIDQDPEFAARYRVQEVPTFIVIDRSGRVLDRTKGLQPAAELARFYKAAVARVLPPSNSNAHASSRDGAARSPRDDDDDSPSERAEDRRDDDARPREDAEEREREQPVFTNPKPWETVVRIRVLNARSIGFGSGTIIHSTPDEALILTCAHIFKLDGRRQAPPSQFPRQIMIDLFDGNLRGTSPAQVHCIGSIEGKAVDYDFKRDVGLIRVRPGRRLPAARVVPAYWQPEARMRMLTVGCSEGHDATAWHTVIIKPRMQGFLTGNNSYEAIECLVAPKQGRSGGGLFTSDGYLAGVCNFAEPQGDHGLYATPRSIYSLLDRNSLMALYSPVNGGSESLLANRVPDPGRPHSEPVSVARSQSPDQEAPTQKERRGGAQSAVVLIPPPNLLGIADPVAPASVGLPKAAAAIKRSTAWQPSRETSSADLGRSDGPKPTDLNLDPSADHDRFGPLPPAREAPEPAGTLVASTTPASVSSSIRPPSRSRWRAVKATDDAGKSPSAD